jgi:hypothetical protein
VGAGARADMVGAGVVVGVAVAVAVRDGGDEFSFSASGFFFPRPFGTDARRSVGGVGAARDVDRTDAAVGYLFLFLFAQRDDDGSGPARLGSVAPGPPGLGSRPDDLARFSVLLWC